MKNPFFMLLVALGFVAITSEVKGQTVAEVLRMREKDKNSIQSAAKVAEEQFRSQLGVIKTPVKIELTWLDAAKSSKQQLFNALEEQSKLASKMPQKDPYVILLKDALANQKIKAQSSFDSLAVAVNASDSLTYVNGQLEADARSFENKLLKLALVKNQDELNAVKAELQSYMDLMTTLQKKRSSFAEKIGKVSGIKMSLSNQAIQATVDLDGVRNWESQVNPKKKK